MSYGIDFPNISTGNLYTAIDPYVATGSQTSQTQWPNGALNPPGAVYAGLPWQYFTQYSGFSTNYAPATTVLGTTSTSVNVTAVTNTTQLSVGMTVTGSGVPTGTTIAAIPSTTTLTLSKATTTSVTLAQLTCFFGSKVPNGVPPVVKYVRYSSQNNPTLLAYSAGVYYTDSTCTTVSGYANEAYGVTTNNAAMIPNACAGVLLANTTSGATAAALNGNWCWIAVGGLVPNVSAVASVVIGDSLSMSVTSTNAFTVVRTAQGTANPYQNYLGVAWSNLSTNTTCDVLLNPALQQI